ncbi:MAG: MerR family transcriptional regulator [Alphaproteobacteria bacterium]|nr:MerR family transcriptional regulator [Alphaproteobacteria bacterium]
MAEPFAESASAIRRSGKSADAFRTISEVAGDLDVPQHVLRFWETRFTQIKPLKRAGGRRYYRPEDVELLRRIRELLYKHGYTIKGVQRLLKDHGLSDMPIPVPVPAVSAKPQIPTAAAPTPVAAPAPVVAPPLPLFAKGPDRSAIQSALEELEALRALLKARTR